MARRKTKKQQEFLSLLCEKPSEFLAECGKDMGQCCYCGKQLDDKRSKEVGYGPVCAEHFGLPWGQENYKEKQPSFAEVYLGNKQVRDFLYTLRQNP